MIEAFNMHRDDIVGFRIDGTISQLDLKPLMKVLKEKLKLYNTLRLYVEYVDLNGFSIDTLLEELTYNFGELDKFEKGVILTATDNIRQAHQLAQSVDGIHLKSFHYSERDKAYQWIEE
ncbi:STAS/SEC14 domain-containing protein [Porifericola rhodea]|uniref:STAS/SEC14 domain-containing protein n=1 Tax=Porifericola rhodea TaxID=930972 RepID=UPI002667011B|nr:STAS/SEC14 domain-containing protein [Porifericola rhodea]WKN31177.1 STAS/SEC14 domain-containing protein [Porifericola rhodea]